MKKIFILILLIGSALAWQRQIEKAALPQASAIAADQPGAESDAAATAPAFAAEPARIVTEAPAASFSCDGRQHCSQMHSCEEATYFLKNCPGTKMDGDHDGVPCEQQFCHGG